MSGAAFLKYAGGCNVINHCRKATVFTNFSGVDLIFLYSFRPTDNPALIDTPVRSVCIRIRILRVKCILDQSTTLHDFSTELASRHLILCSYLIVDGDDNNRLGGDRAPSKD
jgi:hypothetical protein